MLRVIKSPAEIEADQSHRCDRGRAPGGVEDDQAGRLRISDRRGDGERIFRTGCERSAYAPIVGSGPNSVILHYTANRRRDSGEVVVMDVAAECTDYATDVTANGSGETENSSARQREIYEIVLGAQKGGHRGREARGRSCAAKERCSRSPTITSTRMARICTANRWASISPTAEPSRRAGRPRSRRHRPHESRAW